MPQATLTITYQPPTGASLTDPLWIRIEPVYPPADRATVGQAAALLDRAFGLEVCADGGEGAELVDLGQPALDEDGFRAAAAEVIDLSYCEDGWDGSLDMHLKIIRSHPDLPYVLRLTGCEQTGPAVATSGTASLITTAAATITLEWPVVSGFSCAPEPQARLGNTLVFAPEQVGQTVRASWTTVYDLVPITIPASAFAERSGDLARALAFMRGMVADLELTPEAPEGPDWALCPSVSWQGPDTDDQVTCYQIVRTHRLCECSKYEMGVDEVEEIVPCPDGIHCSNNETECMHLMGTVSQAIYVDCGPTDRTGTVDADLSDPAFYLSRCCEWPAVPLPRCSRRTRTFRGGAGIKNGEQHYRDLYGASTRFVPLTPPGGVCGEHIIEQRIMGTNCCDGVEPLEWDEERSAEVAPINGVVDVYVTGGGRFPYNWIVDGEGFWLDAAHTKKRITTYTGALRIYTQASCGSADIWVADGCSSVKGWLRSTSGRWMAVGGIFSPVSVADPAAHGYTECASFGYTKDSGYTSFVRGRWWVGPGWAEAPNIVGMICRRESSIYGLWATGACIGDLLTLAPGTPTEDRIFIPALVGGVPDLYCNLVGGGGTMDPACLYWNVENLRVAEWVC